MNTKLNSCSKGIDRIFWVSSLVLLLSASALADDAVSESHVWAWDIDWISIIIGLVGGFIFSLLAGLVIQRIQTRILQEKLIRKYGFYPIQLGSKTSQSDFNGLVLFEKRLRELALTAESSIKLCLLTPLIHSLHMQWKEWPTEKQNDHWANEFCLPLCESLRNRRSQFNKPPLSIEMVYLDDAHMKSFLQNTIGNTPPPVDQYLAAIGEFTKSMRFLNPLADSKEIISNLQCTQVPDIPYLLALFDAPESGKKCSKNARGLIAFMNVAEFRSQRQTVAESDIGRNLEPFEFTRESIIRFFSRQLGHIALNTNPMLHQFYQTCQQDSEFYWGILMDHDLKHMEVGKMEKHKVLLCQESAIAKEAEI